MISVKFGIGFLLLSLQVKCIHGNGKISLHLSEYNNPTGTDADGNCCDGINVKGCPLGKCDHLFRICMVKDLQSNWTDCIQSKDITGPADKNVIQFNQQPVQFDFDTWEGEVYIRIEVFDSNTAGNVLVDNFELLYNSSKAGYNQSSSVSKVYNLYGERKKNATSLKLSLSVFCDAQYFEDDCSVKCVPTDQCYGHYTCDHKGKKLCLPGWRGTDCTEQIPGSDVDCSVYTDKKEFVPSAWQGFYSCPGEKLHPFHLNVTKPKDTLNIGADISTGNINTQLKGTYSSFSRSLALEANASIISFGDYNVSKILLEAREVNSSSMFGRLQLFLLNGSSLTCDVHPLNLQIAYFDGCDFKGTCVRYGKLKQNYYCCCYDGTIGTSCTKPTTNPTTLKITEKTSTTVSTTTTKMTTQSTVESTTPEPTSTVTPTTMTTTSTTTSTSTTLPTSTSEPTTTPEPMTSTAEPTTTPEPTISATAPTTSTFAPTTSTSAPTTSTQEPTTIPTTTLMPTTQSTVISTSTVPPTTSTDMPTTSTKQATTTDVKTTTHLTSRLQTTTEVPSTSVVMTTQPTTKPTTVAKTTKPTTVTTTTQPTTKLTTTKPLPKTTVKPYQLSKEYRVNLLMVLPELDGDPTMDVLFNSWRMENKDKFNLTKNNTKIQLTNYFETVEVGVPITVVKYKVEFSMNTSGLKVPSDNIIANQLKLKYNTNHTLLYTDYDPLYNMQYRMKFYVYGPGPRESQKSDVENAIMSAINMSCEASGKCDTDDEMRAVIKMTEEYVGDDGVEITEISYFIEHFGIPVLPTNCSDVSMNNYTEAFNAAKIKILIYKGTKTLRFRFHYKLLIVGKVAQDKEHTFEQALTETWKETFPGIYSQCKDCYSEVVRQEKNIDGNGKEITALVYFFYFHSIVQVPFTWTSPNISTMVQHVRVWKRDTERYTIYTGDTYYRYRHHFSLLVDGRVDSSDVTRIRDNLQAGIIEFHNSTDIQTSTKGSFEMYSDAGDIVTELVCFMTRNGRLLDSRLINEPSLKWLHSWFVRQKVLKRSDKPYNIYVESNKLYSSDDIFTLFIDDFTLVKDTDNFKMAVVDSWNETFKASKVEVSFIRREMYMVDLLMLTRNMVTGFHYLLKVDGIIQHAVLTSDTDKKSSQRRIYHQLSDQNYTLTYDLNSRYKYMLPLNQHFELFFRTELSSLDLYTSFPEWLIGALKAKWTDFRNYANLKVDVAFQEKVYLGSNHLKAWRVVFFLTFKEKVLNPEFVTPITELLLYTAHTWTGPNTHKYKLYTESRSNVAFYYKQHFNLLLTREVSVYDWKRIETDLKIKWCKYLGCVDNSTMTITATEQEKYIDHTGEMYGNLEYFVHWDKSVIDSRRYKGISVTKDTFKWTNQYGGMYEVAVKRPATLWKYSYGFNLYTDSKVTTQRSYLTKELVKAWSNMGLDFCVNLYRNYLIAYEVSKIPGLNTIPLRDVRIGFSTKMKAGILMQIQTSSGSFISLRINNIGGVKFIVDDRENGVKNEINTPTTSRIDYTDGKQHVIHFWRTGNNSEMINLEVDNEVVSTSNFGKTFPFDQILHNAKYIYIGNNNTDKTDYGFEGCIYEMKIDKFNALKGVFQKTRPNYMKVQPNIDLVQTPHRLSTCDVEVRRCNTSDYENKYTCWSGIKSCDKKVSERCQCLQIAIINQRQITDIHGNLVWELTYFIHYNGYLIHSATWPTLNPALVSIDTKRSFRILTNIDTKLYKNLLYFYSNYKLSKTSIDKMEREITNKFLEKNAEYKTCRCVSVKIISQEQVVNRKGEKAWKISYHINKNSKAMKPSTIHPFKWSTFLTNMTDIYGHKYIFFWSWTDWKKYFHYSYLGGLYVGSWVSPSYYGKFGSAVFEYYKKYYKGKNVAVEVLNQTEEYFTSKGEKSWRIPFLLKVDGKIVNPPALNTTDLESLINFTTTNGKTYKLLSGRHTIDAKNVFSFNLNHKVSTTDYNKTKEAVINAWCTEHPEIDPSTVTVDITGQEELVDRTTGKSSWKLLYTLAVNGSKIDKRTTQGLTNKHLSTHLNFTSVTGVTYSTVNPKSFVSRSHLFQVYFKSYVPKTDFKMVTKQLQTVWKAKLKEMGLSNVDIEFIRQKQVMTKTGERIWKWGYVLNINNSAQITTSLPEISFNSTEEAFQNSTSTSGKKIIVVAPSTSYVDYDKHFSIYVGSKVTSTALETFSTKIIQAWRSRGLNVSIDLIKQEELVDKVNGKSVWRLLYFVKKGGQIIDSRTSTKIKTTSFHGVTGPRGVYRILDKVNPSLLVPYQWSGSVVVNNKFSVEAREKMSQLLKQMVERKIHVVEERYSVCNEVPADIQFLLDSSGSVGLTNFKKQIKFVAKFAESFTIGPDNIQIGVTTFSTRVYNKFFMNKYSVKSSLVQAINNISYDQGGTNTDKALKWVGSNAFTNTAGSRNEAANIVIVMTDGKSQNQAKTKQEADKLHQANIRVFAIGIGKGVVTAELYNIASDRNNVFTVQNFDVLNTIQAELKKSTCKEFIKNTTVVEETVKNITVDIKRQEEYVTTAGKKVWKLVYFIKVDGQLVPATSLPSLDLDKLVLNITGPRGQKYQVVKGDKSTLFSYRNRFSIFFNHKITEKSLTTIKSALLETWNSTTKEYSSCKCLSVVGVKKENIEEFVDSKGKSYWRLMYFLKKNNTVVESMTQKKLNLDLFRQKVKGLTNQKQEKYIVANITESKLYRTKMAFSFYLKSEIGFNQTEKIEEEIKTSWIKKLKGSFTSKNTEVIVNRYVKYIDVNTMKTLWKVEYYLKKDGIVINPAVIPRLANFKLTLQNAKGSNYEIVHPKEVVDNRMSFKLFLNRKVRKTDLVKFQSIIKKCWMTLHHLDNNTRVNIEIPEQSQVIKDGRKHWMLSVFIKQGSSFVDSRVTKDLNTTQIQQLLNFKGVNGDEYVISGLIKNYKRMDAAFSLYLTKALKRKEITSVLTDIKKVWKEKVFKEYKSSIAITLGNQEWYLDKMKTKNRFSKLNYFLTVGEKEIHPDQVPDIGVSAFQKGVTGGHMIVPGLGLFSYNSLFHIDFTRPVLKTDRINMQKHLAKVWTEYRKASYKIEIFKQEELVTTSRSSIWRLSYRINSNNVTVSPEQENTIPIGTLQRGLNLTETGSGVKYNTLLSPIVTTAFQYKQLFSLHFTQRVDTADYVKMEAKLAILWKKSLGKNVKSVKILKQEQSIDIHGKITWKLSYHVTTDDDRAVNNQYDTAPSFNVTKKDINVTNPLSQLYQLLDVRETFRLSQAFTVIMNRRIYNVDQVRFRTAFKKTLSKALKVTSLDDIKMIVSAEEKVVSTKSSQNTMMWRYQYVMNVSGDILDATEEVGIKQQDLQQEVNFTSPRKQQYIVMKSNEKLVSYSNLFYVNFHGSLSGSHQTNVVRTVKMYWKNVTKYNNIELSSVLREEFIEDISGKSITRYRFSVAFNGQLLYPSLTQQPDYSNMSVTGTQVVTGTTVMYAYNQCYKLVLQSQHKPVNQSVIQTMVKNVWKNKSGTKDYKVHIVSIEKSVGAFGALLTSVLYTVRSQSPVTPDIEVKPDMELFKKEISKTHIQGKQYGGKEYRVNSLYSISLRHGRQLTVTDRQVIQTELKKAVSSVSNEPEKNVVTEILFTKHYVSSNTSIQITKLYYKLDINKQTIQSWERTLTGLSTKLNLKQIPEAGSSDKIPRRQVFTVYLKGKNQNRNQLESTLRTGWIYLVSNREVTVNITHTEVFVDKVWNIVTKVSYIVNIDDEDPESLGINPPSYDAMETLLNGKGMPQCGCGATSLRKHFVYSKSINVTKVKTAITTVWKTKNTELSESSLSVRVKSQSTRHKRAAQPSHKLVDDNGNEVTPMEYTVAVEDEEPQPLFVTSPTNNDIKNPLKQAGSEPCLCKPKLAGSIQLDGKTKDGEKPKVADAIKDAFVKENPDVSKEDLDVMVTGVDNDAKDKDGNPVSEVKYRVGLKTKDVDDLNPPSTAHLSQSLATAHKTLHSRSQKPTDKDEEEWVIPLAIALGVLAGIIVIAVIACIICKRRHRKKGDLVKRENDLKQTNAYDEEHFSNPAAYDNKAYDFAQDGSFGKK